MAENVKFMEKAIALSAECLGSPTGGPFGAIIVKNGEIIGQGFNQVSTLNDPTAHAEIQAVRDACKNIKNFALTGCEIYCSCQPCPMCLSAIYWARIAKIYYGATAKDAAAIGFSDQDIYNEFTKPLSQQIIPAEQLAAPAAVKVLQQWHKLENKTLY